MTGVEDRLLNTYALLAKKIPILPLVNKGETRLQPTYVRDAADAIIASLNYRETLAQTYHLAGPDTFT